jgi:hypothetical protein
MLAYDYGRECPQGAHTPQRLGLSWRRKAPGVRKNDLLAGIFYQPSFLDSGRQFGKNSFLNDQCGNVIENKGPLWKTRAQSRNVYEKKGT